MNASDAIHHRLFIRRGKPPILVTCVTYVETQSSPSFPLRPGRTWLRVCGKYTRHEGQYSDPVPLEALWSALRKIISNLKTYRGNSSSFKRVPRKRRAFKDLERIGDLNGAWKLFLKEFPGKKLSIRFYGIDVESASEFDENGKWRLKKIQPESCQPRCTTIDGDSRFDLLSFCPTKEPVSKFD